MNVSEQQLEALGTELGKRLNPAYVRAQRIRWIEDVDDQGEVMYIPVLDEFGIGEDAMVSMTWPAVDERGNVKTIQIINLELLDDVGAEELAEMLAPDLKADYATLLQSGEEQ